jgi:hypothetical protein
MHLDIELRSDCMDMDMGLYYIAWKEHWRMRIVQCIEDGMIPGESFSISCRACHVK